MKVTKTNKNRRASNRIFESQNRKVKGTGISRTANGKLVNVDAKSGLFISAWSKAFLVISWWAVATFIVITYTLFDQIERSSIGLKPTFQFLLN